MYTLPVCFRVVLMYTHILFYSVTSAHSSDRGKQVVTVNCLQILIVKVTSPRKH